MPSSRSSTSSNPARRAFLQRLDDANDYQGLLYELLAVIHRDGGQYTTLAGLAVAIEDAELAFHRLREQVANYELLEKKRKSNG